MIFVLFTTNRLIWEKVRENFWLEKVVVDESAWFFDIYKKWAYILVDSSKDETLFKKAMLYVYSEYDPDFMIFLSQWTRISNEVKAWDVILPNVFFEYSPLIEETELYKTNRDDFLKNPIFLENYSLQSDYDFESFWLSVWWICVSWEKWLNHSFETVEKLRIAYEADLYDEDSYWFLDEAKKLGIIDKTYVLSEIGWAEDVGFSNLINISHFLIGNLEWRDGEGDFEEDEDE